MIVIYNVLKLSMNKNVKIGKYFLYEFLRKLMTNILYFYFLIFIFCLNVFIDNFFQDFYSYFSKIN